MAVEHKIVKPLIKWVGGKTQIVETIVDDFPKKMKNYHEIFVGGGSVLLAMLNYVKQGKIKVKYKIYAYDVNYVLINLYKNIQTRPNELYEEVIKLKTTYFEYSEKGR